MKGIAKPLYLPIAVAAVSLSLLAGCDKVKEGLARQAISQARSKKVDRGFHIVDGEAVFLDSNAGEGQITRKLPDAEITTFRALKQPREAPALFAVDAKNVYMGELYRVVKIADADASTFELLTDSGAFSRDSRNVYYMGVELEGADPATFQVLEFPFGRDAERAYLGTIPIPVEDIESWRPMQRGSADDPWYRSMREKHPRSHQELLGQGWSKDRLRVFWGENAIEEADAATFVVLSRYYGKDKNRVYFGNDIVNNADSVTFVVHDGPYIGNTGIHHGPGPDAHDAQRKYKSGRVYTR